MDKAAERRIFDLVYGDQVALNVTESEKPDFACSTADGAKFGVEVTEFFISESAARLRRRPDYIQQLLRENRYLHKDDRERIPISKIVIQSNSDGSSLQTEGVVGEFLTRMEVAERFVAAIVRKNSKSRKYSGIFTDIDLVIDDVEGTLVSVDVEDLIYTLHDANGHRSLIDSGFREIFVVTDIAGENTCVPLRANLFAAEVFAFHSLAKEFAAGRESISTSDFLNSLGIYLDRWFSGVEIEVNDQEYIEFIFASIAMRFDGDGPWKIRSISCQNRSSRVLLKSELGLATHAEMMKFIEEERAKELFCVPIAFSATSGREFCMW